jgi:hypothetical protein
LQRNSELAAALIIVILLTAVYVPVTQLMPTRPSSLIGHGIGILGFLLMLATETLYSLRKRSRRLVRWGRMQSWLSVHIFTGIVGPYMVFLHTGWRFAGLAGVTMLLTAVVVASGFVGRYIYTAVPRTLDGALVEVSELEVAIQRADSRLQSWLRSRSARLRLLAIQMGDAPSAQAEGMKGILGRLLQDWAYRRRWRRAVRGLDAETRRQSAALKRLLDRRRRLQRQIRSQETARRMMAVWHALHVPLGMALFAAAFMHIIGALFYS